MIAGVIARVVDVALAVYDVDGHVQADLFFFAARVAADVLLVACGFVVDCCPCDWWPLEG